MATQTEPLRDDSSKVNDDIAVGSDLQFQNGWWRFEQIIWIVFTAIVFAGLLGVFGRGFLSKAEHPSPDSLYSVEYERIARFSSPSVLTIYFNPAMIRDGRAQIWMSEDLIQKLGAQRVIPEPVESLIQEGGILYTFRADSVPAAVRFALEPLSPGKKTLRLRVPGSSELALSIWVLP